jgi:hypothetical protein
MDRHDAGAGDREALAATVGAEIDNDEIAGLGEDGRAVAERDPLKTAPWLAGCGRPEARVGRLQLTTGARTDITVELYGGVQNDSQGGEDESPKENHDVLLRGTKTH